MLYAVLFTIGAILVTSLLYLALRPKSIEVESEGADLRYIGFALVLIILTAFTVFSLLYLGKMGQLSS